MKVEIEIPDPDFELEPNQKLECRGFGWDPGEEVEYAYLKRKEWHRSRDCPRGVRANLYFEIVEEAPMPPKVLNGHRTEYVGKGKECKRIVGKRFATYEGGKWEDSGMRLRAYHESFPNVPIALMTPIPEEEESAADKANQRLEEILEELKEIKETIS